MRSTSLIQVAVALGLLAACATFGRSNNHAGLSGTYAARLTVAGRSTYTGTLIVERSTADSLFGALRLTSPITVEMPFRGGRVRDTLRLHGDYSAANGCTGTMDSPLVVAPGGDGASGQFTLADKCAGALRGTMELSR